MKRFWRVRGLWLLVVAALLSGCADGGAYRGAAWDYPSVNTVPPSFYGNNPALRHWYIAPYFNPDEMP